MSPAALDLIGEQLLKLRSGRETTIGVAFVVGLTLALWSARKAGGADGQARAFVADTLGCSARELRGKADNRGVGSL